MSHTVAEARPVELWVSISRYAQLYGVSRPTVYKWLKAGLLDTWKVRRCLRVRNQQPKCKSCDGVPSL